MSLSINFESDKNLVIHPPVHEPDDVECEEVCFSPAYDPEEAHKEVPSETRSLFSRISNFGPSIPLALPRVSGLLSPLPDWRWSRKEDTRFEPFPSEEEMNSPVNPLAEKIRRHAVQGVLEDREVALHLAYINGLVPANLDADGNEIVTNAVEQAAMQARFVLRARLDEIARAYKP